MSTGPIITDLQKINPSAIIELIYFNNLIVTLHGAAQTVYRFHNGSSLVSNGDIVWAGNQLCKNANTEQKVLLFRKGQLT